ncbi:hypothetical protein NHH03_20125 [Stieleria sp. TO1_6]|uniref:hypothetical protein n=1 Tax=Stieleria tagensis TaxID=2956795 RepID=UPI00209B0663|nr:hypothetical protein [Stieleria tagensis]MCO8124062.1 hypothetical protein [Stieleria tagensis]
MKSWNRYSFVAVVEHPTSAMQAIERNDKIGISTTSGNIRHLVEATFELIAKQIKKQNLPACSIRLDRRKGARVSSRHRR